ncbi:MAG: peptidase M28, partial [Candidatus Hydrogenedentes bacterium]|nr:peptidase M28 [Candidatus Hydrogenedentota bacterium]
MQFLNSLFPVLLVLPAYAQDIQAPEFSRTQAVVRAEDVQLHVEYLASEAMEGRLTGTEGERLATEYAAGVFEELGLTPAGENGSWFQPFEFTAGVSLGSGNRLCIARTGVPEPDCYPVEEAWRPLAFSKTGSVDAPVVFAGYGIVAPALEELPEYDSYVHLDVTGKWVVVFRYIPEDISTERRLHLTQYASLRYKAMVARDRGAAGIVFVSGPNSQATDSLVGLQFDASFSGTSVAAVSVTDRLGEALLSTHGRTLEALQSELDTGEPVMGFEPPDVRLQVDVDIVQEKRTGRNVLGRLTADEDTGKGIVVVGAHIDHLGRGRGSGSLARDHER